MKKFIKVWAILFAVVLVACQSDYDAGNEDQTVAEVTTRGGGAPTFDGQSYYYKTSPKAHPFDIVITGDGFTAAEWNNGSFEAMADEMMDAFFSIEPYKSYKDYFRVYILVAHSNVSGITNTSRDTKFGSYVYSSTIEVNKEAVFDFAEARVPNFDPTRSYVVMFANCDAYGGACDNEYGYDGRSLVKMAAFQPNAKVIHIHESAHGIAKLGDEYINPTYNNLNLQVHGAAIIAQAMARRNGSLWNYAPNLDFVGESNNVEWAKYYNLPGYEEVGHFAGGAEWLNGCWRSTEHSIMQNNLPADAAYGFNAISREAIVRRILYVAGETFNFQTFLANDSNEKPVF
jgi:hypothetical protein